MCTWTKSTGRIRGRYLAAATLAAGCTMTMTDAAAASFDCTRASTTIDLLVCRETELSRLDDRLALQYAAALKNASEPQAIRKSQRLWLRKQRASCVDATCLAQAYTQRIEELTVRNDEEACSSIAKGAHGRGVDNRQFGIPRPVIDEASANMVEEILGGERYGEPDPGTTYLWHIDFDGDGIKDTFAIDYGNGTMHIGRGHFLSGVIGSGRQDFDAWDKGALDLSLVSVSGRFYVLSSTASEDEDRLDRLWRIAAGGKFRAVCSFEKTDIRLDLTDSLDDSFCQAVSEDRVKHVTYALEHGVKVQSPLEHFYWSKYPKEGLARIDIDNDNELDNVIRIQFSHGAGRGCNAQYLAVTDDTQTAFQETPLNKLLMDNLGGFPCGPNLDILIYGRTAYIDARGELDRSVFRIRGLEAEQICAFRGRVGYTYRMRSGTNESVP